jgi:AraC family transcriptional regulator of adaptative response/methylated-DNA-[protein]-cysteine methyltransferase
VWPHATWTHDDAGAARWLGQAFAMDTPATDAAPPVRLLLRGTNFQVQVWKALLAVAPGEVVSYQALAARIGRPRAARAVGTAVAANTIACLIPCHRVIRESGDFGQYRWGPVRKAALLAREACAAAAIT